MSRVLLINGSPNEFGCTYTALSEVKKSLEKNGVAAEIYYLGKPAIHGCTGCDACSKLDRCMYDDAVNAVAARLQYKLAAAVVSCRRAGSTASLDRLIKYFTINNMPLVSSQYWAQVHGTNPDEVRQDAEGMQTMRTLGENMAWLLRCIEAGKAAGVPAPAREPRVMTNFMR